MTEQNGYVLHEKIMEEIEYAAMLFDSPAWKIIREGIDAENTRKQISSKEERKRLGIQKYIDLKCIEMAHLGQDYYVRAVVRTDRQGSFRFYFWKDGLPEVEVKPNTIVALGVSKITEQLDALYRLQAEIGML